LVELNFYNELDDIRLRERIEIEEEFDRLTMHGTINLDIHRFGSACRTHRYSLEEARAFFRTFDLDGSLTIDRYEYGLYRTCITNFNPERDNNTSVVDFRIAAIFNLFDPTGSGALDTVGFKQLLRYMSTADRHVDFLLHHLHVGLGSPISLKDLTSMAVTGQLHSVGLFTRSLFKPHCVPAQNRHLEVVYNIRALEARAANAYGAKSARVHPKALNEGLVVEQHMISFSDIGGSLVMKNSQAYRIAKAVITNTRQIIVDNLKEGDEDIADSRWMNGGNCLLKMFGCSELQECVDLIRWLAEDCCRVLKAEPVCAHVSSPVKVFGDIHGQFRDLLLLLREYGYPSLNGDIETVKYLFNGDWVDRGNKQIETVVLLFALKIVFPSRVFLVRGNHEFRQQNFAMEDVGFHCACRHRFRSMQTGDVVFAHVHAAFEWLPLTAIVDDCVLVLHGGIGDGNFCTGDLAMISRPLQEYVVRCVPLLLPYLYPVLHCISNSIPWDSMEPLDELVRNILWSDPIDGDERMQLGVHGSPRDNYTGRISRFTPEITEEFCLRNSIKCIIRSHQFVDDGYKIMHKGKMITVFSARNYDEKETNNSALILLAKNEHGQLQINPKKLAHF
jgi:diadenosine tetraphosphatase ApaH/serine/threonine PP2A family protein phosphatase/Ca2+-binding EF-hand superfamily protein